MLFLGEKIAEKGIVMQLHYGAQRNTNTVMFDKLGAEDRKSVGRERVC